MKELKRYITREIIENKVGGVVLYEDAMQAVNDRQRILDQSNRRVARLLECVEVADRMRALLADVYAGRGAELAECEECMRLYDDRRSASMGEVNQEEKGVQQ